MKKYVMVDHDGSEHRVIVVSEDGEHEADGAYRTAAEAERRAEVLSKMLRCEWGGN